ncbi:MAG: CDP-diacylglycerol---glycerol-3-phosphate 3-phosphatidyltransferase [Actinomycetota bacterium]|nr:CDP-diacylglycerol---glycerol-3-phosphate 3-phosphatidyltransferase [Actinomycetota bacterium]
MLNQTNARSVVATVVNPVARGLIKIGLSPDAVTLIGTIGVSVAALVFFPEGRFAVGVLVIVLFVFSDLLDGTMARMLGRKGPWGAFLDSTLDRIADGFIFGALLVWASRTQSDLTVAAALICLVGGMVISYAKARAEGLGIDCNVGIAERTERLIIILLAAFVYGVGVPYVLPAAMWLLAVLTVITVMQRILHVRKMSHLATPRED